MRHKTRWLALLLALLMLLCGTAAARAVEDRRDCSITLLLGEGEDHLQNPLRGGKISLYCVVGMRFEGELGYDLSLGQFAAVTGLPAIAELTTQELDRQNASLSAALLAAAKEQGITPMQVAAVTDGKVQFSELPVGLYLLTQTEASENGRSMKTFLLSVPDGSGAYDVVAAPKPGFQASAPEPSPPASRTAQTSDQILQRRRSALSVPSKRSRSRSRTYPCPPWKSTERPTLGSCQSRPFPWSCRLPRSGARSSFKPAPAPTAAAIIRTI